MYMGWGVERPVGRRVVTDRLQVWDGMGKGGGEERSYNRQTAADGVAAPSGRMNSG